MGILSNKRILITGGTGHIGSHLVARLAAEPIQLQVVARDEGKLRELKRINRGIQTFPCDIAEPQEVLKIKECIGDIDYLVHLAGYVPKISAVDDEAVSSFRNNVAATVNVLNHFGTGGSKICFASTAEVYGMPRVFPISEEHSTEPRSYYGAGKLAAEKYVKVFSQRNGCPAIILRFASVYGPGEVIQRAIPNFIKSVLSNSSPLIYGDGLELRDYVYVEDAVDAIILALEKETVGDKVYNIASGCGHRIGEIAELIIEQCGGVHPPLYQPARKAAVDYVFDISSAQRDLNYSPKTDIKEGLQREIAWFRSKRG